MTDAAKVIAENTSRVAGGIVMKERFFDIINPKPQDDRSADEIINHIKNKLRAEKSCAGEIPRSDGKGVEAFN